MKHYGKRIPAKDVYMSQCIEEKILNLDGMAVFSCHSANPNIFEIIGNSVDAMSSAKTRKQAIVDDKSKYENNYWDSAEKKAKKHKMDTIEYLSYSNGKLPERCLEYNMMLEASARNIKFINEIKRSIIKAKREAVYKVKKFLERTNKERTGDERS